MSAEWRLARWEAIVIVLLGAGDLVTGVLLVASPTFVESLLFLAPSDPEAATFVRWIGVFVGSIGAAYLLPWRTRDLIARRERLRFVLEWAAWARLAVAAFVGVNVLAAALPEGWCLVGAYDALAASGQLALLAVWTKRDAV